MTPALHSTDDALIAAHLHYLRLLGYTEGTIYARCRALTRLARALEVPLPDATVADLSAWRCSLTVTPEVIAHYIGHAVQFYGWLQSEHGRPDNPAMALPVPRYGHRLPRPIATEQLHAAVATAPRRIRPWLVLAAWCGLRAREIAFLRREHVLDTASPPRLLIALEAAKGGRRERSVPLHGFALAELAATPMPRSGWLFRQIPDPRKPNEPHTISHLANRHLHGQGIPATLHQLRHWFGTGTYQASRDLRVVQELLGHASPVTTAGYAAIASADAERAVSALPALRETG